MLTNVMLIDDMPKKEFQNKVLKYFKSTLNISNDYFDVIHIKEFDLYIKILNNAIFFNSACNSEKQDDFIKKCILDIFKNSTIAYESTNNCDWLIDEKDINAYKI